MKFQSIQTNSGSIFDGEKIGELTQFIVDKFSKERLSYDEAVIVLEQTKEIIGDFTIIQQRN